MTYCPVLCLERIAAEDPCRNAVHYGRWYTYGEFNSLVDRAASFLLDMGFGADQGVPLFLDPSLEALVLVFAALKIGGYYVPFAVSQPPALVEELLADSGFSRIVCNQEHAGRFASPAVFEFVAAQHLAPLPRSVRGRYAYQLFTSGTTGKPKGVLVTRDNLDYIGRVVAETFPSTGEDTLIWSTAWTFDVSLVQLVGWCLGGSKLVVSMRESNHAVRKLPEIVGEFGVTQVNLVPTMLSRLLEAWSPDEIATLRRNLRFLMLAGEALSLDLALYARKLFPETRILNLYGPTETSIYATVYEVTGDESGFVPIGRALPGVTIRLLADDGREVAQGDIGEVYIFGDGVAEGYANRPDLTAAKFVTVASARGYATGDYGRLLPSGDLEFLGRHDRQVKINGIRLELGEIESRLDRFFDRPGKARILFKDKALHLFYLSATERGTELKAFAEATLPAYAVPMSYVALTDFPTTVNGKLDEAALWRTAAAVRKRPEAAVSVAGAALRDAVLAAFDLGAAAGDLTFAELGVDSLGIMVGLTKLERELGVAIPDSVVLGNGSPHGLTAWLARQLAQTPAAGAARPAPAMEALETARVQLALWKQAGRFLLASNGVAARPTHASQKLYFFDQFASALTLRLQIVDTAQRREVERAVLELIARTEMLRSGVKVESERLTFAEAPDAAVVAVPRLKVAGAAAAGAALVGALEKLAAELDKTPRAGELLHTPMIVDFDDATEVVWSLSHLVCDRASTFLLKQQLMRLVQGAPAAVGPRYSELVNFIHERSRPWELLEDPHTKELLALGPHGVPIDTSGPIQVETLPPSPGAAMLDKTVDLCFHVGRQLARATGLARFAVSTVINLRDFDGFNAAEVIGDCHSTMAVPFHAGDTPESFRQRFHDVCIRYRTGASPYHAAFSDYPRMSPAQKALEQAHDTIPLAGVNFLGFLPARDAEALERSLAAAKQALLAFPGCRVYVTAFETAAGELNVRYLTYPRSI